MRGVPCRAHEPPAFQNQRKKIYGVAVAVIDKAGGEVSVFVTRGVEEGGNVAVEIGVGALPCKRN